MDREQSWQVITEQRLGLAQLLEGLSDTEWEQPSLCAWMARPRRRGARSDGARRFPGWDRCSPTVSGRGELSPAQPRCSPCAMPHARRVTSSPSCARTRILAGYRW